MGLLDDAIREHLELKRRRGADPDEIARQEDEALGDPRSGEFARPAAEPGAEAPAVFDEAAAPAPPEEELPAVPAADAEPPEFEPAPAPEPEPEAEAAPGEPEPDVPAPGEFPRGPVRAADDDPWLEDERDDRLADAGQATAPFTPPDVEPDPEVVRPDDEPPGDEDVLEETPDFLQETPEHDRLWFEQKPPRDFDFDN